MRLLLATRNKNKVAEIRALFELPHIQILTVDDVPGLPEVVEDGNTFRENAVKKAVTLARAANEWTLADDSGLEVDALGGLPGVHSARYAGEPANDEANNRKLLDAMTGQANRAARFRCVLALAKPDGTARTVTGVCEGSVASACRGTNGFGYDPLFVPVDLTRTFGEMQPAAKNRISHRASALAAAREAWGALTPLAPCAPICTDRHTSR